MTADRDLLAAALFRGGADNYDVALDLLLPVVDRIARELDAAAEGAPRLTPSTPDYLRARAAALRET